MSWALGLLLVPHGVALALFAWRGFPREAPRWWAPRRVGLLWRALLGELAMARHLPLWLRWQWRYRASPRLVRGVDFGSAGPRRLDVYREPGRVGAPCVVFAYGGGWGSGTRTMYALLAERLVAQGLLVAVPDYATWPQGDVWAMADDLARALAWVRAHAAEHGGDPARVLLLGHSAGAHLWALHVLQEHRAGRAAPPLVALAGPFDVGDQYRWEWGRGVESVSALWRAMGETEEAFARASPQRLLGQVARGPGPRFRLLHGTVDGTVPAVSSERFAAGLRERGFEVEHRVLEGAGHAQLVLDLMRDGPCTAALLEAVMGMVPNGVLVQ